MIQQSDKSITAIDDGENKTKSLPLSDLAVVKQGKKLLSGSKQERKEVAKKLSGQAVKGAMTSGTAAVLKEPIKNSVITVSKEVSKQVAKVAGKETGKYAGKAISRNAPIAIATAVVKIGIDGYQYAAGTMNGKKFAKNATGHVAEAIGAIVGGVIGASYDAAGIFVGSCIGGVAARYMSNWITKNR